MHESFAKNQPNSDLSLRELFGDQQFEVCKDLDFHQHVIPPGAYIYQQFFKGGVFGNAAVLVAKVETPESANFVWIQQRE